MCTFSHPIPGEEIVLFDAAELKDTRHTPRKEQSVEEQDRERQRETERERERERASQGW